MTIDTLSRSIGRGLVAGLVGTAVMTVSEVVEARIRGRAFSTVPAEAAQKVLGISTFEDDRAKSRFSDLVHWGYGTGFGVLHGLLRGAGLKGVAASAAHGTTVWGGGNVVMPTLGVTPPFWLWGRKEIAIDVMHHAVYTAATGIAYSAIERRGRAA
ncbi:MAG: hypothetical protein ACKVUT_02175 [Gaiella sp.]